MALGSRFARRSHNAAAISIFGARGSDSAAPSP
jgi:hypothetical protein